MALLVKHVTFLFYSSLSLCPLYLLDVTMVNIHFRLDWKKKEKKNGEKWRKGGDLASEWNTQVFFSLLLYYSFKHSEDRNTVYGERI